MSTQKLNNLRTTNAGDVVLTGDVFITAAGAITANSATTPTCTFAKNGFTVAKNAAAGRYDVTFYRAFKRTKSRQANIEGPASAAFPTTTGSTPKFRAPASAALRQSTAIVQLVREDTQADADAASGTVLSLHFIMATQ